MSASSTNANSKEIYDCLVDIIYPEWAEWPSSLTLLEVAILPSSSHPGIQYDHKSNPRAVGIPKRTGLACFLHARRLFFSHIEAISVTRSGKNGAYAVSSAERTQILQSTAVMLVWEPNHLTAINWRRRVMQQLLQATPASEYLGLGERARRAELIFLESLLTSPMSQHAKSSLLWAYRLQLLRPSELSHGDMALVDPSGCSVSVEDVWRIELSIVMKAGERHPKNYYAWEYARQVYRLLIADTNRENKVFRETLVDCHQWCLMHPTDISGWAFLASRLQQQPDTSLAGKEVSRILAKTKDFAETFGMKGESVTWFFRTMSEGYDLS